LVSYGHSDRLLMGSPLRRRGVCLVTSAVLPVVLAFATLVHLGLIGSMRADVMAVFLQALVLSSLLAAVPLAVLWFLDRRERETPWLFAAAFLWGGCIATALALPLNTAFFLFVDAIVAQEPSVEDRARGAGTGRPGGPGQPGGVPVEDRACITAAAAKLPNVATLKIERSRALPQTSAQGRGDVSNVKVEIRQRGRTEFNLRL
jgi:hypothetical protein